VRTLSVTSPYIRGNEVKQAQKALQKNPFGQPFYRGEIDGEFGPLTASASKDAKFWLGYQTNNVVPGYGQGLHEFLKGEVDLSGPMEQRRKARMARPPETRLRQEMLKIAVSQLGIKESPAGTNKVKFSQWYGMTGPWCAMFVTWCGVQAGLTAFVRGSRWAYCPYMVSDALAGRNGLRARGRSEAPQPGDVVLFDWQASSSSVADHVGIFEKGSRASFTAIEGNTSVSNNSNGGEVMRRERTSGTVELFCYAVR
jgi:CHAP domain